MQAAGLQTLQMPLGKVRRNERMHLQRFPTAAYVSKVHAHALEDPGDFCIIYTACPQKSC